MAVLDPEGQIVVITARDGSIVLDDEMQLLEHLSGPAYQKALNALRDARTRRHGRTSGA